MPFIGKQPKVGAYQLIDSITTSATATYALTVDGSAYFPESARNLIVSLNGVTQAPDSAYTVSGSNIVFDSALTASDVIDYIMVIGDAVDIGTPSDGTVGTSQMSYPLGNFSSTGIDDNATSTAITIDSTQRVGIGTDNPSEALTIAKSGTSARISLTDMDSARASMTGLLEFDGTDNRAGFIGYDAGDMSLYAAVGDIKLSTGGAARLTIDETTGNVGIGGDGNAKLEVFGPLASPSLGTYNNSAAIISNIAGGYGMSFSVDGTGTGYIQAQNFTSSTAYNLSLNPAGGNVGIGVTDPAQELEVAGAILASSVPYSSNQDEAYLIAGTAGWTGATTNWNTFGFQHRIKTDGGGVPRVTIDNAAGEVFSVYNSGVTVVGGQTPAGGGAGIFGALQAIGFGSRSGVLGSQGPNCFNIYWSSPSLQAWVDSTNIGTFSLTSDYRIKRNIESMSEPALARIAQLRPVTYQPANFKDLFEESDEIKEGFIAHELQEVIPSAVDGEKDAEDQIQSLKVDALCAVLTKAIQEQQVIIEDLQTRLSALEAN